MEGLAPPFRRNVRDFCGQALIYIFSQSLPENNQILLLEGTFKEKDLPKVILDGGWTRAQALGCCPGALGPWHIMILIMADWTHAIFRQLVLI